MTSRRRFLQVISAAGAALGVGNIAGAAVPGHHAQTLADKIPSTPFSTKGPLIRDLLDDLADAIDAATPNGTFVQRDKMMRMMSPHTHGDLIRGLVATGRKKNPKFGKVVVQDYIPGSRLEYEMPEPEYVYDQSYVFSFAVSDDFLENTTGEAYQLWIHDAATRVAVTVRHG